MKTGRVSHWESSGEGGEKKRSILQASSIVSSHKGVAHPLKIHPAKEIMCFAPVMPSNTLQNPMSQS